MKKRSATEYDGIRTYTKRERTLYLWGLLGQNIIYNIIGAGLQYFFESVIFMPALAIGAIMTSARVWDAFNDPMMGTIVDRTRTKWGKCRPYLLFAPLPIFIITVLCFTNFGIYTNPNANHPLIIAWAAITYILWGMLYTIGDIPLWGITAVMTERDDHRNKILSLARVFAGIGGGITLVAIQPLGVAVGKRLSAAKNMSFAQGQRYGFLIVAIGFAFIGCALFQLVGIFTKERISASEKKNNIKENFKLMWSNKPFRQILISGILSSPKNLIMIVAMTLVNIYYANNDSAVMIKYYLLLGTGLFIGQFVAMLIMPELVKKIEKKTLYNWCNIISAVPFIMIFICYEIAPSHDVTTPLFLVIYAVMFALAGISIGATTVLQSLMIADCIDYEEYKSGLRPDAVFFSGQSFITKLASGIATIISSLAYHIVDFQKERREQVFDFMQVGVARTNPEFEPFMMIMFFLVSIPPAIGCILSAIPTWKYALPDKEHSRILKELTARRHSDENDETDK
ncbi:MAG: glycoside-pentoside-hexuronide (GPH):cation symporter [Clostridiales bacterium]|nr:glycoside-pentoside-hexuronide (GPH):cation symporter [Clostridiales bacterium]